MFSCRQVVSKTNTHFIFLYYIFAHHNTTMETALNCTEMEVVFCFVWEGQVVSRKAEVNLRLSGPGAD